MVHAIVGACWGDEGKGKITDMFAEQSDIVVRYQGGANAGHTIINDKGRVVLHLIPSGACYTHTVNVIGNGVALDIGRLLAELDQLHSAGVNPRLMISDRAQVVMPWHLLFDGCEEARLAGRSFGSTKSGIAPFYSDKYAKTGITVGELYYPDRLREKIDAALAVKNLILEQLYHRPPLNGEEIFAQFTAQAEQIRPYVADTFSFLSDAVRAGKNILLEGQLGSLKDPDLGIYPMTTSSHTLAGFGSVGAGGIPPYAITRVTAVVKAYSSAVGAGPFVSEIFGDEADRMREHGGDRGEYGATTGRPRRMGWFDTVAARYGCRAQGATEAVLTVVDALGYLDEIRVCVGYEVDGKVLTDFPINPVLERAKPVLRTFPGWKCDIRGIRSYRELPAACRDYIAFVEEEIGVPVKMVTNGPRREDVLYKPQE